MSNIALRFSLLLFAISILMITLHGYYSQVSPNPKAALLPLFLFYPVLLLTSIVMIFAVHFKLKKNPRGGAKTYVLFSTFKFIIIGALILPYLIPKTENSKFIVAHFFLIFFSFLLVETIAIIKLINSPFDEKRKKE